MHIRFLALIISLLFILPDAWSNTTTKTFAVSAVIDSGCIFGSGVGDTISNFGNIDFGTISSLDKAIDVASSSGAGSIVITCTPGISMNISLDYGVNGGNSSSRYMINNNGTNKIAYQLYQNADYSTVWGTNDLAYKVSSFPATTQTYTVYGRVFSSASRPPAGTYTDSVTVTLTY